MNRRGYLVFLSCLLLLLGLSAAISCAIGSSGFIGIPTIFSTISAALGFGSVDAANQDAGFILMQLRLPRLFLGIFAGINLAVAGLIMQTLFQNTLADPYVIGISSGASLGAVTAIALGLQTALGLNGVAFFSFIGAIAVTFLVYFTAKNNSRLSQNTLLLTGISIGALAQAGTTLVLFRSDGLQLKSTLNWLFGGLSYRDWNYIWVILPYTFIGSFAALLYSQKLNLLAMGDDAAHHLGVRIESTRLILIVIASLLAASAVSTCGIIGFIGLIVPNVMRMILGPNHQRLLPACILGGALLLTSADTISRILFSGQEVPIGIITSLIGGVFFIYLIKRKSPRSSLGN